MVLDEFPLTSRNKLDRKALPEPPTSVNVADLGDVVAASSKTECSIEGIWKEVLKIDTALSVQLDFVTLGGNSLLAGRA